MAESKKTTEETVEKKKTTKAPAKKVEEAEVERRFCTKCGRELKPGEVCDCDAVHEEVRTVSSPAASAQSDPMLSFFKGFLDKFKNIIKKPATTLEEEAGNANVTSAIILFVIGALSCGLLAMAAFKSLMVYLTVFASHIGQAMMGTDEFTKFSDVMETFDEASLPYGTQFLWGVLGFVFVAVIIMVVTYCFAKYKRSNIDFKKILTLFTVSMLPLSATFLILALVCLINNAITFGIALVIGIIVLIICLTSFINAVTGYIEFRNENSKVYSIAVLLTLVILGVGLFTAITWKPIGSIVGEAFVDAN